MSSMRCSRTMIQIPPIVRLFIHFLLIFTLTGIATIRNSPVLDRFIRYCSSRPRITMSRQQWQRTWRSLLLSTKLQDVVACIRDVLASEAEKSRAGIVIFHSAPVLAGADASLIGALVEQTLLTIVVGSTTRAQAKQAQEQLQQAHTKLSGIVM